MDHLYWRKQTADKPLFPDLEWSRPEQKTQAGKLTIIGGNKLGFVSVATAYSDATAYGIGQLRVVLPADLRPAIPANIIETVYVASNLSGGLAQEAEADVIASLAWSDRGLLIGDAGRNSETAMIYEKLLSSDTPLTITRDAVDLLKNTADQLVNRPATTLVLSFAQLQKLFQAVYYPKMLSFSMQLSLLVDNLHKFTISYPTTIVTYHQNQIIIAHGGEVISQEFDDPMLIWRGSVATRSACYQIWSTSKPLEAIATSIASL